MKKSDKKVRKQWNVAKKNRASRKDFIRNWEKDPSFDWITTTKEKSTNKFGKELRTKRWLNEDQLLQELGWTGTNKAVH